MLVFGKVLKQHKDSPTSGISTLCPTRGTVCTGAMQGILDNYLSLEETMEASSHRTEDCSRRASAILALRRNFKLILV